MIGVETNTTNVQAVDQLIGADQVQFSALYRILLLFAGVVLVTVVSQWLIQRLGNRVAYLSVADLRKKCASWMERTRCEMMMTVPRMLSFKAIRKSRSV